MLLNYINSSEKKKTKYKKEGETVLFYFPKKTGFLIRWAKSVFHCLVIPRTAADLSRSECMVIIERIVKLFVNSSRFLGDKTLSPNMHPQIPISQFFYISEPHTPLSIFLEYFKMNVLYLDISSSQQKMDTQVPHKHWKLAKIPEKLIFKS